MVAFGLRSVPLKFFLEGKIEIALSLDRRLPTLLRRDCPSFRTGAEIVKGFVLALAKQDCVVGEVRLICEGSLGLLARTV